MTSKASQLLLTIYAIALANPVVGFGQRFEVLKGASSVSRSSSTLEVKKKDISDSENNVNGDHLADYREALEHTFGVYDGDSHDPLQAFLSNKEDDEDDYEQTPIRSALDYLFNFDTTVEDDEGIYLCEGGDCDLGEECLIPDTFKIVCDEESPVDVMAFLGIERAAPLKARKAAEEWQ